MPYALAMRTCIAELCNIGIDDVSIKATTNEKMGFIGRNEGIVAYANVLMKKL
jgi:2-C-methyl-D-erythritol 2,4-cyclodiphosphate synthase